jgi:hypothetical protein
MLSWRKVIILTSLVALAIPRLAHAGNALIRLSALTTAFDGKVILLPKAKTPVTGGIEVYGNSLKVPGGNNVMYITFSGTGFGVGGGVALNCQVDGVNCIDGIGAAGTGNVRFIPTGWVIPLGDELVDTLSGGAEFPFGATGLGYHWCTPLSKTKNNVHSIVLNAASAFGGKTEDEFLEAVVVFVDVNGIGGHNACGTYDTPNPVNSPD